MEVARQRRIGPVQGLGLAGCRCRAGGPDRPLDVRCVALQAGPDRAARPDEDAGVPACQARGDQSRPPSSAVGFSTNRSTSRTSCPATVAGRRAGQHVAVAGLGAVGRDPQGHQSPAAGRDLGRGRESAPQPLLVGNVGVGRQNQHHLVVRPGDGLGRERHGRGRVAAHRLAQEIRRRELRQLFADERQVAPLGDDVDVGRLDQRRKSRHAALDQRLLAQQPQERLGAARAY